jgi:hypothetical protein
MADKTQTAADGDEYEAYLARALREAGPIPDDSELIVLGMGGHPVAWTVRPKVAGATATGTNRKD